MQLTVHRANDCRRVFGGEQSGSTKRGLDVRYNERCGKAFTGRIEWFERFFQILRNGTLTESIAYLAGRSVGVTFQIAAGVIVMRERVVQKQKRPASAKSAGQNEEESNATH